MNYESVVALVIATIFPGLFTLLLWQKRLTQSSYVILFSFVGIVCLVLHGFPRLRILDLKNLTLTMDRIESIRADVYASRDQVEHLSFLLTELILFENVVRTIPENAEMIKQEQLWIRNKCREILDSMSNDRQPRNAYRFQDAFDQFIQTNNVDISFEQNPTNILELIRKENQEAAEKTPSGSMVRAP